MLALLNDFYLSYFAGSKRLFIGHLLIAGLLTWAISGQSGWWRKRHWWHASSRGDLRLMVGNFALFLLLGPWLLSAIDIAKPLLAMLEQTLQRPFWHIRHDWLVPAIFTITLFIVDDFARFYLHRLMHRIPALWAFHQVHHSARRLTPLTVLRTHPIEAVLFSLRTALINGVLLAVFVFCFGHQADLITLFGANIINFAFNLAGSNLRHSMVYWRYWPWLERWLISPAQHQIHHSAARRHHDTNFGAMLAIWDRLFGSLYLSDDRRPTRLGVTRRLTPQEHSLVTLYWQPVCQSLAVIRRYLGKKKPAAMGWLLKPWRLLLRR